MRKVILIVLDGFGLRDENIPIEADAIALAKKPNFDFLYKNYPWVPLHASGEYVGLPDGQMGNSEVGHLNIGAGRIVYQDIVRISKAIRKGEFFKNEVLLGAIENVKRNNSSLHLVGLLSDGGVHSHMEHLYALLELAKMHNIEKVYVHALLDGRDTPPSSAIDYIREFEAKAKEIGVGKIAVVGGRYYGMDRDNRWERTEKYYKAMTEAEGEKFRSAEEGVLKSYEKGVTDEFVVPFIVVDENWNPIGQVKDGDSIIFFNFRADRARQLTRAFIDKNFDKFNRKKLDIYFVTMTEYDDDFDVPVAFKPVYLTNTLGEVISKHGLKQLRIAETEKYAHVTYFFSGGREDPFEGEDRILIPSPKVATYDLKPEMSAFEVTDKVIEEMDKQKYSLIVLNFANPDMVGHTGIIPATVKAIEAIDTCIGRIYESAKRNNYVMLITADHGNAEKMLDPETGEPHTAHTTSLVPFILVMDDYHGELKKDGKLGDIAPTILKIMDLPIPPEMDGEILLLEKVPQMAK